MTSAENEFLLPRVEESDLLNLAFEDVTDPAHEQRWKGFAGSNEKLTREVLKRAYVVARAAPEYKLELQKIIRDEITYVYAALTAAALRLGTEDQAPVIDGDGDGEDLPLSV
jgi:hypothetical protein